MEMMMKRILFYWTLSVALPAFTIATTEYSNPGNIVAFTTAYQYDSDYYDNEVYQPYNEEDYENLFNDYEFGQKTSQEPLFDTLPSKQQALVQSALNNFEQQKEEFILELSPAYYDTLHQKLLLELKLKEFKATANDQELVNIEGLLTVLKEKEQILSNITIIKDRNIQKLYNDLKEEISVIISEWFLSEFLTQKSADNILAEWEKKLLSTQP